MSTRNGTTRARVIAAIDAAWRDFRRSVQQLPPHDMETPGVCDRWSVKDLLGHITSWETRAATALLTGVPDDPGDPADVDEFNRAEAARKAPLTLRDIVVELESTHRALQSALADAPEGLFESGSRFRETLDANTFSHYVEHTAQIRTWAAVRRHPPPDAHPHR